MVEFQDLALPDPSVVPTLLLFHAPHRADGKHAPSSKGLGFRGLASGNGIHNISLYRHYTYPFFSYLATSPAQNTAKNQN